MREMRHEKQTSEGWERQDEITAEAERQSNGDIWKDKLE